MYCLHNTELFSRHCTRRCNSEFDLQPFTALFKSVQSNLIQIRSRWFAEFTILLLALCCATGSIAQAQPAPKSPNCKRSDGLNLIREQIASAKLIDNYSERSAVLVRAADLLWSFDRHIAKETFLEAFEVARRSVKEKTDLASKTGTRAVRDRSDDRFFVLSALALRDSELARELMETLLHEEAAAAESSSTKSTEDITAGTRLLDAALAVVNSNVSSALNFARASLRYPASVNLPIFLYRLAAVNQRGGDEFYVEALNQYRSRPLNQLLYLSSYPFGNPREVAEIPTTAVYTIPAGFVPNLTLQRRFIEIILTRTSQISQSVPQVADNSWSDAAQLSIALTRLELQTGDRFPDLTRSMRQANDSLFTLLPQTSQSKVKRTIEGVKKGPSQSFAERVEFAEKESDPNNRDRLLVLAVMAAAKTEEMGPLTKACDKIADSNVRNQLLDWLHFIGSQVAIREGRFDEAKKLIRGLTELDQRAYLYSEIAKETIGKIELQASVREILDEVAVEALKAPNTIVKARTILALAQLYSNVELPRSIEMLAAAIHSINHLEAPDFSSDVIIRKIEGATFGVYATYQAPGFRPETVFRELGSRDWHGAFYQANSISDKTLRASAVLALASVCLSKAEQSLPKPKSKATR